MSAHGSSFFIQTPLTRPRKRKVSYSKIIRWSIFIVTILIFLIISIILGQNGDSFREWLWLVILFGIFGSGLSLLNIFFWQKIDADKIFILLALTAAVAFRIACFSSENILSDDAFRYIWDGKVLLAGFNPYMYAPNDNTLDFLRNQNLSSRINHPEHHTVYPPFAQLFFFIGNYLTPGRFTGLQIIFLLAEIFTWLLLLYELQRRNRSRAWILLASWSPLFIVQGYLPGHVDILAMPWFILFIIFLVRKKALQIGLFFALASLIKPLFLIFLPVIIRELGARGSVKAALMTLTIVILAYLPFASAGWHLLSSTWLMFSYWSFNGSLMPIVAALLPSYAVKWVAASFLMILLMLGTIFGRDLTSRLLLSMVAFIICTTTLFPWYLVAIYPLLLFRPDPALLWLGGTIGLADMVQIEYRQSGVWYLPLWIRCIEYIPFYLLLALGIRFKWGMFANSDGKNVN